jgi:hypothetical protein
VSTPTITPPQGEHANHYTLKVSMPTITPLMWHANHYTTDVARQPLHHLKVSMPTITPPQGEHANHYTTDVVSVVKDVH